MKRNRQEIRMAEEDNVDDKKKIIIGFMNLIGIILFTTIGLIIKHFIL